MLKTLAYNKLKTCIKKYVGKGSREQAEDFCGENYKYL